MKESEKEITGWPWEEELENSSSDAFAMAYAMLEVGLITEEELAALLLTMEEEEKR